MKPSSRIKSILVAFGVAVLILSVLLIPVNAEKITNDELKVSIDVSFSTGQYLTGSVSGSTINASATGYKSGWFSDTSTQTVTITNNSGKPLLLRGTISISCPSASTTARHSYSIKNNNQTLAASKNAVGGSTTDVKSYSYTSDIELANNTSLVISITSPGGVGLSSSVTYTPTIYINEQYTVTFANNATYGSYTVDSVAMPESKLISVLTGTALEVTPVDGYTCVGFVDTGTGHIVAALGSDGVTKTQKTTFVPSKNCTIAPVYVRTADAEAIYSVKGQLYYTWDSAAVAAALSKDTMILLKDHTLSVPNDQYYGATVNGRYVSQDSSGIWNYTVPAGATFLVPFNSTNTLYTATPGTAAQGVSDYAEPVYAEDGETILSYNMHYPTQYRKLTISSGVNVNVEGGMSISGMQSHQQGYNGCPVGPQGFVELPEGAKITVKAGGTLYAWGYLVGTERKTSADPISEGTVEVLNGGTVYECFQVLDWRGGTATSPMVEGDNPNGYKVFPISQYAIQNIQVPLTLNAGANEIVAMSIDVTAVGNRQPSFKFVGPGGFISTDDKIVKDYDENTDRMIVATYGTINVSSIELTVEGAIGSVGATTLRSKEYNMPLPGHMTIHIMTGSVTITQDVVMLPGFRATIAEGTTLNASAGCNLIAYDADQWGAYTGPGNSVFKVVPYAYSRIGDRYKGNGIAEKTDLEDAMLLVNGTLDLSNSYLYTTTSGANICSTGNGIVKIQIGTMTVTKQASQSGTSISYVDIPLTSAKLHNANPSTPYTETATGGAGTYTYCLHCGMWVKDTHTCSKQWLTNVSLANNLHMHFAFNTELEPGNYEATVTHYYADGRVETKDITTLTAVTINSKTYVQLIYEGVAAKEMVDAVYVTLYDSKNNVVAFWGDSIREYAHRLYKLDSTSDALKTLIVDMLNYGAACQVQFQYNTGNLASNRLSELDAEAKTYVQKVPGTLNNNLNASNISIAQRNLEVTSNIQFHIAFNGNVAGKTAIVTYTGHKNNPVEQTLTVDSNGCIQISGMVVADYNQEIKITIDGTEMSTKIIDYITDMGGSETNNVFYAFSEFAESAYAYLHPNANA